MHAYFTNNLRIVRHTRLFGSFSSEAIMSIEGRKEEIVEEAEM